MKKPTALALLGLALLSACNGGDTTAPTVTLAANVPALPGVVTYTATASDASGIQRVEFYQGTTLIDTDTTAPYSTSKFDVDLSAPAALTAKAYDPTGNEGTASISITHAAYQGQYVWAAFTDVNDIAGSTVADGVSVIAGQTATDTGDALGLGGYGRLNPLPEQYGPAGIGLFPFEGQKILSNVFLYDQDDNPLYLFADDADGQFSDVNGSAVFAGGATLLNPDSTEQANTYFLMVRVTADPFQTVTPATRRAALNQASTGLKGQLTAQATTPRNAATFGSAQKAVSGALRK